MLLNRHLVESTSFDFCFGSEDSAFKEQEQIASLVKKSLVPIMLEVFDEVSPDEQVFRLDALELDLGEADIKTYRSDLPSIFRKKLLFALRQKGIKRQIKKEERERAGKETKGLENLRTLSCFLSRGTLPWHASRNGERNLDRLLDDVLGNCPEQLIAVLKSDTEGVFVNRLADQFSHEVREKLLRSIASRAPQVSFRHSGDADVSSWKRRLSAVIDIPKNRFAEQSRMLRLVSRSILTGRLIVEKDLWTELVKTRSPFLIGALLRHGKRADVRRKLAQGFPEPALKDIVTVLEPVEADFIEEIVSSPQMFTRAALNIPPERTRRHLFEYTLGYLIVDRGSRFNKKAYLENTVRKMAARENERLDEMLASLVDILSELKVQSRAAQEMRIFLSEMSAALYRKASSSKIAVDSFSVETTKSAWAEDSALKNDQRLRENRPAFLASLLKRALEKDDIAALMPVWQELTASYSDLLKGIILQYARRPDIAASLARSMTFEMLFDLIRLITPAHASLVERSCARLNQTRFLRAFKTSSQKHAEAELRQIVLTCLLDEAAAGFDRRGYLFRLVKKIASRDNRAYTDVLDALIQDLGNIADRDHELDTIFSILKSLGESADIKGGRGDPPLQVDADIEIKNRDEYHKGGRGDPPLQVDADIEIKNRDEYHKGERGDPPLQVDANSEIKNRDEYHKGGRGDPPLQVDANSEIKNRDKNYKGGRGDPALQDIETQNELEQLFEKLPHLLTHERERLEFILRESAEKTPKYFCEMLANKIQKKGARDLVRQMPEALNMRILRLLEPEEARIAVPYTNLLVLAAKEAFFNLSLKQIKQTAQEALFRFLIVEGRSFSGAVFARFLSARLNRKLPTSAAPVSAARLGSCLAALKEGDAILKSSVIQDLVSPLPEDEVRIKPSLSKNASDGPRVETSPETDASLRLREISRTKKTSRPWSAFLHEETPEPEPEETLFVDNAGLALVAPFLPRLFMMLNLTEASAFKDFECRRRAVHLTQFIVDERSDVPEYALCLNKLLCGMTAAESVPKKIIVTETEKQTVTAMLLGMIKHWKILKNTSLKGFRESFLQREGRLCISDKEIRLFAAPRPFDMLLDQLPWSFNIIKLPWMKRMIYVDWR